MDSDVIPQKDIHSHIQTTLHVADLYFICREVKVGELGTKGIDFSYFLVMVCERGRARRGGRGRGYQPPPQWHGQ